MKKWLYSLIIVLSFVSLVVAQQQDNDGVTVDFGGDTLFLNIFDPAGGWGNVGILALLGLAGQLMFAFLVVAWVMIAILAGLKMVKSQGNPEEIEGGAKWIQNMLMGITIGLIFFIAVSILGWFVGVGTVFQWSDNLQDCSCENSAPGVDCYTYKFQAKASREEEIEWVCYENSNPNNPVQGRGWQPAE